MRKCSFVLSLLLAVLCISSAQASTPHYLNGVVGVEAATIPPAGFYFRNYNVFYHAGDVMNNAAKKVDVDYQLDLYLNVTNMVYVKDVDILGAKYVFTMAVPLINVDLSIGNERRIRVPSQGGYVDVDFSLNSSSFGLSDIEVDPFNLSWKWTQFELFAGCGVLIPSGRYSSDNPSSPGRGYWTVKPTAGATIYFDQERTFSASALFQYEFQTKQKDTDITPGQQFHFEWGVGKRFAKYWTAGAAGYCSWQTTLDKGPRASQRKSRLLAAGPELSVLIPKLKGQFTLRSLWEFNNRNASQGNITTATYSFIF